MNDVKRTGCPIQTKRDGNKITKICVEDYYKIKDAEKEQE